MYEKEDVDDDLFKRTVSMQSVVVAAVVNTLFLVTCEALRRSVLYMRTRILFLVVLSSSRMYNSVEPEQKKKKRYMACDDVTTYVSPTPPHLLAGDVRPTRIVIVSGINFHPILLYGTRGV